MSKKMVVKRVCIEPDYAEGIKWRSRLWDIPESELMQRALTALAKGVIPSEHLLTESDRERMRQNMLKRWEEGRVVASSPNGKPTISRESVNEERINRLSG